MSLLLMLLATLAAAPQDTKGGAIEATITGTAEPLEVDLLLREPSESWTEVDRRRLPAGTRRVRFDGLESGVYQLRLRGPAPTEQLGTKVAVGKNDARSITIPVQPYVVTGRVTLGGTELGEGLVILRHRELHWRAGVALNADGTFRAPLWQHGPFSYNVRSLALPTEYSAATELEGTSSASLVIEIPDGRIQGILRDAKSGEPVDGVRVALQTNLEQREEHTKLITGPDGRFDFVGMKYGRHTVRIYPPHHLEPEPIVFTLGDDARLRELDVRLDPGREVAIIAIDANSDPVANAKVVAVTESQVRARTVTDEDGRAAVAVPADETATLFVIPEEGPFGMLRITREPQKGRLQIHLPRTSSSLLIRALTTSGAAMPPFSLLMRYNGELVPPGVAEELSTMQGLELMTGANSEALLRNIPSGSYEFWPYRTDAEAQSIIASADALLAPIQVNVRTGENKIAVKFAARGGGRR